MSANVEEQKKYATDTMIEVSKLLITLSSGFFVLSAALIKALSGGVDDPLKGFWILLLAWLFLFLSIVSGIIALGDIATTANDKNEFNVDQWWTKWGLRVQQILFLAAFFSIAVFATLNRLEGEKTGAKSKIPFEIAPSMQMIFEQLPSVGHFESGKDSLLDCNSLSELNDAIKNNFNKQYTLNFMILAGKVDKHLLNKASQKKYGSNFGLAQRRAIWVKGCLIKNENLGLDQEKLIAIATGPEQTGTETNGNLKQDRVVHVYAFWTKTKPSLAVTASNSN